MQKQVIITGVAGFIGSHLAQSYLQDGFAVVGIDNLDPYYDVALKRKNLELLACDQFRFVEGDIRDTSALSETFAGASEHTCVVHLAAKAGVRPSLSAPAEYLDVNVQGLINVLEECRNRNIVNIVFGSSSSVYGNNRQVPFSEDHTVDHPVSPYAASKKAGELICHTYTHLYGMNITCLRFFTVYGPRQRPEMAIHKFAEAILNGEEIPMFGDGSSERDYTYVDDIIHGVRQAHSHLGGYHVYNLGESDTISLRDLIDSIAAHLGTEVRIKQLPMQPGDVDRTYADISKAKKEIEYTPKTKIQDGLQKFCAWKLDQRKGMIGT